MPRALRVPRAQAKPCSSWFQGGSQFVPCTRLRRSIEANGSCGLDPNGHWPLGDGSFNRARNHYRGRLRLLREALDQVFGYCRPLLRRDRQIHHMDDHTSALRACIPTPSRLTAMRGRSPQLPRNAPLGRELRIRRRPGLVGRHRLRRRRSTIRQLFQKIPIAEIIPYHFAERFSKADVYLYGKGLG